MSRVQTPGFGTINLQPVASPTNQFAQPEVRAKSAGTDLQQLAQGLARLSPEVQQIADRRFNAEIQGYQNIAPGVVEQLQLKNQADLKQAVTDGKIPWASNPWGLVYLKQAVASQEAYSTVAQVRDAYNNDPVQFSKSLNDVSAFVDSHFANALKGKDVWEAKAMAPVFDDAKNRLIQSHVSRMNELSVEEAHQGLANGIFNSVEQAYADDPTIGRGSSISGSGSIPSTQPTSVDALAGSVRMQMQKAGAVLPFTDVNKIAIQAITNKALQLGDAGVARDVMDRIETKDGAKLGSTAEAKQALYVLDQHLITQQYENFKHQEEVRKIRNDHLTDAITADAQAKWDEGRKTNPALSLGDIKYSPSDIDRMPLDPETKLAVKQQLLKLVEDTDKLHSAELKPQREALLKSPAVSDILTGKADPGKVANFMQALIAVNGLDDAGSIMRDAYDYKRSYGEKQPITPEVFSDLAERSFAGTLNSEYVLSKIKDGSISTDGDMTFWFDNAKALRNKNDGIYGINSALSSAGTELEELVTGGVVSRFSDAGAGFLDVERFKNDHGQEYLALQTAKAKSKSDLFTSFANWDKANPQATYEERMAKVQELKYAVSTANGGWNENQWKDQQKHLTGQDKPVETPAPVQVEEQTPKLPEAFKDDAALKAVVKTDPILGNQLSPEQHDLLKQIAANPGRVAGHPDVTAYSPQLPLRYNATDSVGLGNVGVWLKTPPWKSPKYLTDPEDPLGSFLQSSSSGYATPNTRLDDASVTGQKQADFSIKTYQKAMAVRLALKSQIENRGVVQQLQQKLSGGADVSPEDRRTILLNSDMLRQYAYYTHYVGYTANEVKDMGGDAWKGVPLFAGKEDMKRRFGDVVKTLGLSSSQAKELQTRQQEILYGLSNDRTNQFGND